MVDENRSASFRGENVRRFGATELGQKAVCDRNAWVFETYFVEIAGITESGKKVTPNINKVKLERCHIIKVSYYMTHIYSTEECHGRVVHYCTRYCTLLY